jgi:TRAP-type C4-dicarboxylate transport system substrate-binding protein
MFHKPFVRIALASCALAAMLGATAARAELNKVHFEVIVGNHTDPFTKDYQLPFFNQQLAQRSGGRITAKAVAYTELGLGGYEIMNLLKLGTNDISWGVPGYVAGDSPLVEGLELPGITSDINVIFKVQDAYRAIFDRELRKKYNSKLLFWSQQPALQGYCKLTPAEVANFSLATMKGKKTRVHSTSFADFAESIGAVPVTMPFPDVVPALDRGVLDCALTSPTAAYGFKFGQVSNTVVEIRSGYSTQFFAMNLDSWNKLNAETQKFLTEQFAKSEAEMRDYAHKINDIAAKCLANGPCSLGEPARMGYVKLTAADEAELRKRVEAVVLPRWGKRAGKAAAEEWNAAVGGLLGMKIKVD